MEASHSAAGRRHRGRHDGAGSAGLISAAARRWAQEADAAMAREESGPEHYSDPATAAPRLPAPLYFLP